MALSKYTIITDGITKQYPITFSDGYLTDETIVVFVEGSVDGSGAQIYLPYTFITPLLIELEEVIPAGTEITFQRTTDNTSFYNDILQRGALRSEDVNGINRQLLHLVQQVSDGRLESSVQSNLDMGLNRIINLGEPVDDNDAVRWVDIGNAPLAAEEAAVSAAAAIAAADEATIAADIATTVAASITNKPVVSFSGDDVTTEFNLTAEGFTNPNALGYIVFVDSNPIKNNVDFSVIEVGSVLYLKFLTFTPQNRSDNIIVFGSDKILIGGNYDDIPFMQFNETGDDKGVIIAEGGQLSVGTPDKPSEAVFGEGDSYPVPLAFHCTLADTLGGIITNAVNVTTALQSDTLSTAPLFNGVDAGKYLLVGSDYTFGGVKVKLSAAGIVEPTSMTVDYLKDALYTWVSSSIMVTDADNINRLDSQRGYNITTCSSCHEQWRVGFNPLDLPTTWNKVSLLINGVSYNKYWARILLTGTITQDAVLEQLKLHTNRYEVNSDGSTEYFGRSRPPKIFIDGWQNVVTNKAQDAANSNVAYNTSTTIGGYTDNKFASTANDGAIFVHQISHGLDTSIPLLVDISYYVESAVTGNILFTLDAFRIIDGFVHDGTATPDTVLSKIVSIDTSQALVRKTVQFLIDISQYTPSDSLLIRFGRAGIDALDTLESNVIATNLRTTGYLWRP